MSKKDMISTLLIAIGLSFIFGYATHTWYGGLIVGTVFFVATVLFNIIQKK